MKVLGTKESPVVDREKLKQMHCDDESLQKFWEKDNVVVRGQAEISFEVKGGALYRFYEHPYMYVNGGKSLKQGHGSCVVEKPNRRTSSRIDHGRSHGNKENSG